MIWCPGCSREVNGACHHFDCPIRREAAARPRTFAWVQGLRGPEPQILFDDPRVGTEGTKILAERKLSVDDTRDLEQLAAAYPAPEAA